jgi:iron complex outermembrane recepter protein
MHRFEGVFGLVAVLVALCALSAGVRAQQTDSQPSNGPDLTSMNIEDLMNVKVTSVSKKEEKLSRTAAAIFMISPEDVRRSGATSVPDVLRMVPGMNIAQINGST